jgi:diphosphomevalonate decarboxylase
LSETQVEWEFGNQGLEVFFEGKKNDAFAKRLIKVVNRLEREIPILKDLSLVVKSQNTFPHSAGIASSASALSAFALCLCSIENYYLNQFDKNELLQKASHCSRLGSGSAARSVYGDWVEWGENSFDSKFSNEYATKLDGIHPNFNSIRDSILIISAEEKSVSSSVGHKLMEGNPYSAVRFKQANDRISELISSLKTGDWEQFGFIAESEALTLHSLMMSSVSSYILMRPNSITAIEKIRDFRESSKIPVYFSLDAGPNLHILYPENVEKEVRDFINEELKPLCHDGRIIHDEIGKGPVNFKKI